MPLSRRRIVRTLLAPAACLALVAVAPRSADAAPPPPELMARLTVHAAHYEVMRTSASYAMVGTLERVDGEGKVTGLKEMSARVEADGKRARLDIVRYVEDGKDKTTDAREKARESDAEPTEDKEKRAIRMPFLADNAIVGSAWVDTRTATVLTAGFKVSKPETFVDYVHVTVEFGAQTPLGPAVSKVTVDGRGGFLFIRKRFRGAATFSDYRIVPAALPR
jgi:hypothetical protein